MIGASTKGQEGLPGAGILGNKTCTCVAGPQRAASCLGSSRCRHSVRLQKQWRLSSTGFDRCRRGTVKDEEGWGWRGRCPPGRGSLGAKASGPETSHGAPRERGTVTRTGDGVWGWHQLPAHSVARAQDTAMDSLLRCL